MAVDITALQLASAMRIGDGTTALEEPTSTLVSRVLATATEMVTDYAPDAPDAIHNEACIRLAGFLFDAPPGASQRFTNPFQDSGAQSLLARYRVVRAHKLEEPDDDEDNA